MGKPVLIVAALVFVLAGYVWAQVIDSHLSGTPLGLAPSDSTVGREMMEAAEAPVGDVHHY